jgi:putative transposase
MPDYHRVYVEGGTYFFTAVTYQRYPVFQENQAIEKLNYSIQKTIQRFPFDIDAFVILPDHMHMIWTLPLNDLDFSNRWRTIKATFSRVYHGPHHSPSESMNRKGEHGIWQRRFWEHVIRNQDDFNHHCDYIHYNPIKHGLVNSPSEWEYSSFREYVRKGLYNQDWGKSQQKTLLEMNLE